MQETLSPTEYKNWAEVALGPHTGKILPWSVYLPGIDREMLKSLTAAELEDLWNVLAPLSDPKRDLEGERMNMDGLLKAMGTYFELEAPVDLDHMWERTRDLDYLIGQGTAIFKGAHPKTGSVVPWLQSRLFRMKAHAQKVRRHLLAGGTLGYSVAGGVLKKVGTEILQPIVTSVAITAVPVQSLNAGCMALVKCLEDLLQRGDDPFEAGTALPVVPDMLGCLTPFCPTSLKKMMTCAGDAKEGPGIEALQIEDLNGHARKKKKRKDGKDDEEEDEDDRVKIAKSLDLALLECMADLGLALGVRR